MNDFYELAYLAGGVVVLLLILILGLGVPVAYLEGSAKAQWLEETRGIELPWYRAAFLDVDIGDHQIDLDSD